jgi:hypothetical protein
MSQKLFFSAVAILYLVLGVGHVIAPAAFQSGFGITLNASSDLFARVIGSAAIGFAILNWGCRDAGPSRLFTLVLNGQLAEKVIQVVLILWALRTGVFNSLGWVMLIIQGLIGLGFAYFAFGKR